MKIIRWRADRRPTQAELEMLYKAEGLEEFMIEEIEPGTEHKEHKHPFDEVRMIIQGVMRYNVAGNEFILREGDRLELPSNTRHWTRVEKDMPCLSIYAFRVN
jgi:quercetin dioxygenase-like cupin family protein